MNFKRSVAGLGFSAVLLASFFGPGTSSIRADQKIEWRENDRSLKIEIKGEVAFEDDDASVRSLSKGGRFILDKDDGSKRRRIEFYSDDGKNLEYSYFVDGKELEWDAAGKAWLAEALPEVIRESALGAKERVRRIRAQKGPDGVFKEIGLIRSDGAKKTYFRELFDSGELNAEELKSAAQLIRQRIRSDGDKASVLIRIAPNYTSQNELFSDYAGAVSSIRSSGDHRRVLESILKGGKLPSPAFALALESARGISSDGDKAAVLVSAATRVPEDVAVGDAYVSAANTIRSDGDRRRALMELLQAGRIGNEVWVAALKSAAEIHSDGEKAALLSRVAGTMPKDQTVQLAWVEAVNSIRSDGDERRALAEFFKREGSEPKVVVAALKATANVASDGDKGALLAGNAKLLPTDETVLRAYVDAAAAIRSEGDRERSLLALLERNDLNESILEAMQKTATRRDEGGRNRVVRRIAELQSKTVR